MIADCALTTLPILAIVFAGVAVIFGIAAAISKALDWYDHNFS